MPRKKTTQEVLAKFHEVHGSFYDYSLVEYVNSQKKIQVGCPTHGVFEVTPQHHSKGVGCRRCFFDAQKITKEEFSERAIGHFGTRYDYCLFDELPRFGKKVPIICREHGETFQQEPRNHMRGHTGCPRCKSLQLTGASEDRGSFKSSEDLKQSFIARAHQVHGLDYDYNQFEYINSNIKGKILCSKHGAFWQTPNNHLRGTRCPACSRENRKADTFKAQCQQTNTNYWRALKRREAGLPEEKIFEAGYVRTSRKANEVTVQGTTYPNIEEAVRVLKPPASSTTIARWIEDGMSPEEAFERIPNPGYATGIIYTISHVPTGKAYVGLTVQTLERRWRTHIEQAFAGHISSKDSLHAAIREFGHEAFEICQIDQGTTKRDLEAKERQWIKELNTSAPFGFNLSRGGESGGSNRKPTVVDNIKFPSVGSAAQYVSQTRGISLEAAKGRLRHSRLDIRTPAKPGMSLVKTKAYKTWSRIIHGVLNPRSKIYIPLLDLYPPWRDFFIFYRDVGEPAEQGMAFIRLDKERGFFPDNCAWLSKSEASKVNAESMKKAGRLVGRRGARKSKL